MRGIVAIFNAVKGVGFLADENGVRRFFHQNDLAVPGFRAVLVGKEVEFDPTSRSTDLVAKVVRPLNGTGLETASPVPTAIVVDGQGVISLQVGAEGNICTREEIPPFGEVTVPPSVWGTDGSFQAFRAGGMIKEFTVGLPAANSKRVFLALDPNKIPLPSEREIRLDPGSYILSLEVTGSVKIHTVGRRYQEGKGGGNWVVLERRFQHALDLAADLASQIPTSGLERDNDGFIPVIEEAIFLLGQ